MACIARSLEQPTAIYGITPMINGTAGSRHPSRRSSSPWPRPPLATASATGPSLSLSLSTEEPSRGPSARTRFGPRPCKKALATLNPSPTSSPSSSLPPPSPVARRHRPPFFFHAPFPTPHSMPIVSNVCLPPRPQGGLSTIQRNGNERWIPRVAPLFRTFV